MNYTIYMLPMKPESQAHRFIFQLSLVYRSFCADSVIFTTKQTIVCIKYQNFKCDRHIMSSNCSSSALFRKSIFLKTIVPLVHLWYWLPFLWRRLIVVVCQSQKLDGFHRRSGRRAETPFGRRRPPRIGHNDGLDVEGERASAGDRWDVWTTQVHHRGTEAVQPRTAWWSLHPASGVCKSQWYQWNFLVLKPFYGNNF